MTANRTRLQRQRQSQRSKQLGRKATQRQSHQLVKMTTMLFATASMFYDMTTSKVRKMARYDY
jgi:hypothetical protein